MRACGNARRLPFAPAANNTAAADAADSSTAAVRLTAEFGFRELGLHRVEIVAAVGNDASQRAAQKAGATREGVLRNRIVLRGEVLDAVMFSLIPQDLGL